MLLVIEGGVGTGKTTLGKRLYAALGWPLYRSFRPGWDGHEPGAELPEALRRNVPVNTWVDDLYLVDFVMSVGTDVIVDRSMPSALAYCAMGLVGTPGVMLTEGEARIAAEYWSKRCGKRAMIVHLETDVKTRWDRVILSGRKLPLEPGENAPEWLSKESSWIYRWTDLIGRFGVEVEGVATTGLTAQQTTDLVLEKVARWAW